MANRNCPIDMLIARIYKSAANQTVADTDNDVVVLDGSGINHKPADKAGGAVVASNKITICEDGYYFIHGKVDCATDGTLTILKDTTVVLSSGDQTKHAEVSGIVECDAGDDITMKFADTGGGSTLVKGATLTFLEVVQLFG